MDKMMVRPFFAILKKHLNSFIDFVYMEEGQECDRIYLNPESVPQNFRYNLTT